MSQYLIPGQGNSLPETRHRKQIRSATDSMGGGGRVEAHTTNVLLIAGTRFYSQRSSPGGLPYGLLTRKIWSVAENDSHFQQGVADGQGVVYKPAVKSWKRLTSSFPSISTTESFLQFVAASKNNDGIKDNMLNARSRSMISALTDIVDDFFVKRMIRLATGLNALVPLFK